MRKSIVLSLIVAVALGGCGKKEEGEGGKVTPEHAAAEASKLETPKPGSYKTTVDIVELSFPGMPPAMLGEMRKSMAANYATTDCLTEADAKDAAKKMVKGSDSGNCTYTKYDVSGGKIAAAMTCGGDGKGPVSTMTMNGTVGSGGVEMTMESDTKSPDMPGGGMHMKMHLKSERIGECKS